MFKNRALQVKMVKTAATSDNQTSEPMTFVIPEQTAEIIVRSHKEIMKNTVLGVAALIAAAAVAHTLSEVVINNTKPQD